MNKLFRVFFVDSELKIFQKAGGALTLLAFGAQVGCAHLSSNKDEKVVRNSALYNFNRAPQSLDPKMSEEQVARQEADAHFTLAESYSFQGESQKAIEEFKQTLLKDPDSVLVRLKLAAEYIRAGLISEAVEAADSAVKMDPSNVDARMLLAGLYTGVKLYDSAIEQFEEAYILDSSNEEAALFIGAVHAEKGEFSKAENHFFRLLKVPGFKSKAKAYYYLGKISHEKEDSKIEETVGYLKKAVKIDPGYRDAVIALAQILTEENKSGAAEKVLFSYQNNNGPDPEMTRLLAKIYLESKDFHKASEQLEILSKFDASNMSLKIQRALLYMELSKKSEAIVLLEDILRDAPELDKARFYLGALYLDEERFSHAIVQFEKIPGASTYYSDARIQMAQLYKEAKRFEKAESVLREGIKTRDDLPELVAALATTYDVQKKYSQAKESLEDALPKFPENAQLHFFLGSIFDRLGNTSKSIELFKATLEIDSDHVQALNYLAYTYAELGKNLEEAQEYASKALRLAPNDPYILDTVGWIHFKMGNLKKAQEYIEAAYRQKPDEAVIVEHLGDLYVKTESWNRAAAMYQQAHALEVDSKKAKSILDKLAAIENQAQPSSRLPASLPE